ncbi:UDP-3-O-(3-hydroxymyristoyl)glucosamine N-acyltransferase [Microbulbifer sp. A4B17]|uniref:UDP-3-O-(3-hydroxymyristoyl)glucosamine N-acyltransferase n=1 Tax=Microbulbifer sp. A4B17 TaxID=359370 RepID=UPI000D52F06E|nr:UDP-3-O-(3-hydroxymyristoyl)glucosamine N-acyltransferase [Microbulbifer sp. A4B17]AWF82183.1 UDP-3-O-(3-hydroxymyristoyl)glucosamine N-acyltransferase [Microbulbifer sp. A4B17]
MKNCFSLARLAQELGADLRLAPDSDSSQEIRGLNTLQDAGAEHLAFLASPNYRRFLKTTKAAAVLVSEEFAEECPVTALCVADPYLAFARATALFDTTPEAPAGIHPAAVVHPNADIGDGASVGPGAVVEAYAKLDPGAIVGANCFVGEGSFIGAETRLYAGVVIHHGCSIGARSIIHSQTVIGADGFGFAPNKDGWVKIHQLGGVQIGEDVEIGANTCVDRGALGDTVIGRGVKIDNLVQIAHNVQIGDYTAIAGCAVIAGSAVIGKHCLLGGCSRINGHITIADGCQVTGNTFVTKSIKHTGSYSGALSFADSSVWRRNAVRFGQLDQMARRLKDMEKQVQELSQKNGNSD